MNNENMGLFLFASAIKNKPLGEITNAITKFLKRSNILADIKSYSEWRDLNRNKTIDLRNIISEPISITSIYLPQNRWTVVIFNNCHFDEKDISMYLSLELQTLVSLVEVLDSEVWYHFTFYNGKQVDQFCSNPEEYEKKEMRSSFEGNIKKLSFYFDVNEQIIAPYLIPINSDNRIDLIASKAHVDDKYTLGDEWIFIDFWKRLGIDYPSTLPHQVILHEEL
jgi:hypothetical protein